MRTIDRKDSDFYRCGHPRHMCRNKGGSFSKGFFWGAVIGGILGVLFAPEKGEGTRKKIKEKAKDYEEKGKEALEKAAEELEKARIKYEEAAKKVGPVIEKAKEKDFQDYLAGQKDQLKNRREGLNGRDVAE